ncbi:MAG TPA: DUF1318 domain-containing protein [Methylomirabilota bacterium]|nr:DUF1318 domain-containing protein [Methylomirabilota bacterium]
MKLARMVAVITLMASAGFSGCGPVQTKSEVDVKPVDINLNITGRLEVVITDARKQEEQITGSAPKRTVRPEDIGLPASTPTSDAGRSAMMASQKYENAARLVWVADDSEQPLIQQMAARHQQVAAMLNGQLVGESHTGFLVAKASLTPAQQAIVDAENADRTKLYQLEAAKKGTTVDQAALGYYVARLEHVNKGTWVERFNKSTGSWEWFQWDK